ncbi:MAG: dihydropteroate synthase [halophilic archaeon J07HX64]|jgi:Dihydropteroate synthase (EC 2.5.1.15)|nr:MAG: dihydropteroate synthase [halophilic archaeon J07HX64]
MRTVDAAGLKIGDGHPSRIMGVLNVSRESPYDPSVFADPGEAAAYVDEMIDEGADIVDIGLESANKRFDVLPVEGELDRLDTAVAAMESTSGDAVFSIETRYHEVAEAALDRGFDMVNDICGFADPEMPRVCADYDVAVSKMASPPDLERPGALEDVDDIYDALGRNGLTEKTLVDPAFGGWSEEKTVADDRETFRRLREFRATGHPILVSINRKNFLRDIADRPTEEALPVSLAATAMAVERGAHVLRTHDVAETRDAALVGDTFTRDRTTETIGEVRVEELDVTAVSEARRQIEQVSTSGAGTDTEAEDAATAVSRVYSLSGLDSESRDRLRALAGDRDVLVTGSPEAGTGELLLAGSVRSLRDLASAAGSGQLRAVLETL